MLVDLPRRWRWGIGAACGVALLLALVFVGAIRRAERAPPLRADTPASRADAVASTGVTPDPMVLAPDASEVRGADEIQLCGGAWLRVPAEGTAPGEVDAAFEQATHARVIRTRVLDAMRAGPDVQSQAAALFITQATAGFDDMRAAVAACGTDEACANAALVAETASTIASRSDAISELARLAATTRDPQVYDWALLACRRSRDSANGVCATLSVQQWARLDPDNATPWMAILDAARQQHDEAAAAEALYRISTAKRADVGWGALPGLVLAHADTDDASAAGTMVMIVEAMGVQAAMAIPGYQSIMQMCRNETLRDTNRQQVCANAAEVMVARSDTLVSRSIGTAVGGRVGWPQDRIDKLRGEYRAYSSARGGEILADNVDEPGLPMQCTGIHREFDRVRAVAAHGETGELNAWLARSDKSPDDFIRAGREEREQRERAQLDSRATAASAPPPALATPASGGA